MRIMVDLPSKTLCPGEFRDFFFARWSPQKPCYINDPTHLVVKFFRRMMKKSMMMGDVRACRAVLLALLERLGKAATGLTPSDLTENRDAMNYQIAKKVCSQRIIDLLKDEEELATKLYIQLALYTQTSFIEPDTTPEFRIYYAWYVVFFLRIWRQKVMKCKGQTLKNDFVTSNSYICAELNAHGLLLLLVKCREMEMPQLFLPHLASSQDCESIFRLFRSLGTCFFTSVNFNVQELLHKARRVIAISHCQDTIDPKFFRFQSKGKKALH